ncbi:MAG: peptidylprolyl isomerase [Phycisphaerales bacterium]
MRTPLPFALAALSLALGTAPPADAQLAVAKLYFAKDRPLEANVTIPAALKGDPEVLLHKTGVAEPIAKAPVLPGKVDLSTLFPLLWTTTEPTLLQAQLVVGGVRVGPPLVLQPLLTPQRATPTDARGLGVRFSTTGPAYYAGLRVYTQKNVVLESTVGEIEIALRPDAAPNTCWNFRELVAGGFYEETPFHRVVGPTQPRPGQDAADAANDGFMIQTGDALGTGLGGPGYCIPLEKSTLPHDFGVVSMARLAHPDTAGSQFFIGLSRKATAPLDGAYAAFGQVVRGGEVVRAIASAETAPPDNRPLSPAVITRARLVDAPPFGEGLPPAPATENPPR